MLFDFCRVEQLHVNYTCLRIQFGKWIFQSTVRNCAALFVLSHASNAAPFRTSSRSYEGTFQPFSVECRFSAIFCIKLLYISIDGILKFCFVFRNFGESNHMCHSGFRNVVWLARIVSSTTSLPTAVLYIFHTSSGLVTAWGVRFLC